MYKYVQSVQNQFKSGYGTSTIDHIDLLLRTYLLLLDSTAQLGCSQYKCMVPYGSFKKIGCLRYGIPQHWIMDDRFCICTGTTLWQKFHNLCIFLPRYHKIERQQKKLMRYENMVFFTITRSFYYWCTIILKILLFVVCAVVGRGISFTCNVRLWTVNIPQSLTNTNSTLPYLLYFLIKYWWNQRYRTVCHGTVW